MKTLKAYTFEELLCEIPELENFSNPHLQTFALLKTAHKRFCRENNFVFRQTINESLIDGQIHFLFEKL